MKKPATISDLKPAPYNPRRISPEALAGLKTSLVHFGDISGIVWNSRTGNLVAGHQRIASLKALHGDKLEMGDGAIHAPDDQVYPVRIVDWDEETERAANVAANNRHIAGDFTEDLAGILEEIQSDDSALFEALRLDALAAEFPTPDEEKQGLTDPDEVPEYAPKRCEAGDLWRLGNHRLLCGDSTKAEDVARLLGDVKPHLMVTDPPYGVNYDANWRNEADRANGKPYGASAIGKVSNDEKCDWREAWALFPGDVAYVWHAGRFAATVQQSLEANSFDIRCQIIWAKPRFAISRGHYHWQHEPCWYAVKNKGHWTGDRSQTTLWNIEHMKSETGHSTQKPVECMARPMRNNSSTGQAIYEPFCGSGTTIIAGEQLGRHVYAMELAPEYCDIILKRWEDFTGNQAEKVEA